MNQLNLINNKQIEYIEKKKRGKKVFSYKNKTSDPSRSLCCLSSATFSGWRLVVSMLTLRGFCGFLVRERERSYLTL
jgi:hypothetical protein